jgi:hypothetical protein
MAMEELNCLKRCSPGQLEKQLRARKRAEHISSEQRNQSEEDARWKRSRIVKVKFMCCKNVKRLTVILPGVYSK